ncbi:MAG TPA: VanZ family protein [Candidatus Tetragenococcus pullicola]|nr:VanZ family protein [Candidatus Tetragenococcus pullicola]
MSAYAFPIKIALLLFPILAFFLALHLLIKEYRKYGSFPLVKGFLVYSFIFYLLCAYFLVILPLPAKSEVAQLTTQKIQLQPFANVGRFLSETVLDVRNPSTYLPSLKQGVVLEPLFNIVLTIPFGVYLRYYFNVSFKKTILFSFCLSLFFELTQLTGLYFIYPRPYRLADVDDLINNTLGGVIGYSLAPIAEKILPTRGEIDTISFKKGQRVTLTRRFVALFIDWMVISSVTSIVSAFTPIKIGNGLLANTSLRIVQIILYFMVLPSLWNGQTVGKKLVKIRIVQQEGSLANFKNYFKRYAWFYGITTILNTGILYFNQQFNYYNSAERFGQLTMIYLGFFFAFALVLLGLLVVMGIEYMMHHHFYYERLSKTKEINQIKR